MMKRGKSRNESIYVPTRSGALKLRATGTDVGSVIRGMKRMVQELADAHRWPVLDAIHEKRRWTPPGEKKAKRFTLADAYSFYAGKRLDELEALLGAKNLPDHLEAWIKWVRANRDEEARTADVYWQQVLTLIPATVDEKTGVVTPGTFPATDLTKQKVMAWLTDLACSSGTKRKYLYALKSFVRYCCDAGVLAADPLAGMTAPKKNRARERWEPADIDQRITDAASPQYRAFFAFVKSIGCDVGSARRAQRGDVDLAAARVQVRGTKTDRRAVRDAAIERWALPILTEHLKGIVGRHTPLFPGITNSGASHHHDRCCAAVGVEDYTLKDARHSVAVRMRKRGVAYELIAEQLGTSVYQTVTVYSKYKVDADKAKEAQA